MSEQADTKTKHKTVHLGILNATFRKVERLTNMLGARNRTNAIVQAVDIALIVVKAIRSGKTVVIVSRNGEHREQIIVHGL